MIWIYKSIDVNVIVKLIDIRVPCESVKLLTHDLNYKSHLTLTLYIDR